MMKQGMIDLSIECWSRGMMKQGMIEHSSECWNRGDDEAGDDRPEH